MFTSTHFRKFIHWNKLNTLKEIKFHIMGSTFPKDVFENYSILNISREISFAYVVFFPIFFSFLARSHFLSLYFLSEYGINPAFNSLMYFLY